MASLTSLRSEEFLDFEGDAERTVPDSELLLYHKRQLGIIISKKDDILGELERLRDTRDQNIKEMSFEMSAFKKRRDALFGQVRALSVLYFGLKGKKKHLIA